MRGLPSFFAEPWLHAARRMSSRKIPHLRLRACGTTVPMKTTNWIGAGAVCVLLIATFSVPGCKKKVPEAGAKCTEEGSVVCKDKGSAMLCAGGAWQALPCRGGTGCMSMGAGKDNCTNTKYEEGEPCVSTKPECRLDGKGVIECKGNKWVLVQKCAGQNGCVANAMGWKCDMSTGDEGDPCMPESKDTFACTTDKKTMLRCDGTKMVPHATCPGMHGCRKQFDKIECNGQKPIK